jgi:hypothetical protein
MNIRIFLKAYFDWQPYGVLPPKKELELAAAGLKAKQDTEGKWLVRTVRLRETHTDICIPEAQITSLQAHWDRLGRPKSRAKTVAWYIEEVVMPHHSANEHWLRITVDGEPKVEAFLNASLITARDAR